MKTILILIVTFILVIVGAESTAQTTVLTTNGKTFTTSGVEISKESISFMADGKTQTLLKNDVLAVVPQKKPAYTFRIKNNKKLTIKKKDMYNNYTGADKPRMFAYKYLGADSNVSSLYVLNADSSMTEEQFAGVFNAQQKKFRNRNIIALGLAVIALGVGVASLASTGKDLQNLNKANKMLNGF